MKPRERLVNDYNGYIDEMLNGNAKRFYVLLSNDEGEVVKETEMLAHNRSHCFIELTNMYNIEAMGIATITIKEVEWI